MKTSKSTAAKQRQKFIFTYEDRLKFLAQLKKHKWSEKATVMRFAISINQSVDYVRLRLNILMIEGLVEQVQEGTVGSRPRFIYKVKKSK